MRSKEVSGYRVCHCTRTCLLLASPLFTALGARFDDNVLAFYFSDFCDPERFSPFPLSFSFSPYFPSHVLTVSLSLYASGSLCLCRVLPLSYSVLLQDLCVLHRRCKQSDRFWIKFFFSYRIYRVVYSSIAIIIAVAVATVVAATGAYTKATRS